MQVSTDYLDTCVAPYLSRLTACGAPIIPELPNFGFVLGMNQLVFERRGYEDHNARVLLSNFIHRLRIANREYRAAREALLRYVSALPNHDELQAFSLALAGLESCVVQLHIGIRCLTTACERIAPGKIPTGKEDDDYDRLRKLNNRVKHFDEDVGKTTPSSKLVPSAPIWITNDAIECNYRGTSPTLTVTSLSFTELAGIFDAQHKDAHFFAQEWFSGPSKDQPGG